MVTLKPYWLGPLLVIVTALALTALIAFAAAGSVVIVYLLSLVAL
jgi:hypothetical protein